MITATALPIQQAADKVKRSRPSLLQAINKGKISATRDDSGRWFIEPSELARAYPREYGTNSKETVNITPNNTSNNDHLQAEIEGLRRLVDTLKDERNDLRTRLDSESEERRKLTAILTNQQTQEKRRSLWQRIKGQ